MNTSTNTMTADLHSLGAPYSSYMTGTVAWNDNARGVTATGNLSCWGKNITDARILAEDGAHLPFVRPPNMDEFVGAVPPDAVLLRGNDGMPTTLRHVIDHLDDVTAYAGIKVKHSKNLPRVVFRVQNAWVPLASGQAARKIVPAHYSYQTLSKEDPKNAILLCSAQGIFAQTDGPGMQKLFAHAREDEERTVKEHWFTAEASEHKVGVAQHGDVCRDPSKAKAVQMGIEGMGPRANCFVTVSIPLKQQPRPAYRPDPYAKWGVLDDETMDDAGGEPTYRSLSMEEGGDNPVGPCIYRGLGGGDTSVRGVSHAARVSVDTGTVAGTFDAAQERVFEADESEVITVTILNYNTVQAPATASGFSGAVRIAQDDLRRAVDDMERVYNLAEMHGGFRCKLSQLNQMLCKLEKAHEAEILYKRRNDPVPPTPAAPAPAATLPWAPVQNACLAFV